MIPTEEQIRKIWEWCGLINEGNFWFTPNGKQLSEEMPPIDLNNLFRWAVPKVLGKLGKLKTVALVNDAICDSIDNKSTVALALFWAIWKVMEKNDLY